MDKFYLRLQTEHYPNYIPQNVYCSVGLHSDSPFDTDKDSKEHIMILSQLQPYILCLKNKIITNL